MFNFKHEIELVTKEKVWLFGEDYYHDKRVFWDVHQSTLIDLYTKVLETGFPIKIKDLQTDKITTITSKYQFEIWLKNNQPFQALNE